MSYGGAETIEILIAADGTLNILLKNFAERDAQPELDEIVSMLNGAGIPATVKNTKVEYTGEYHKHTHNHGLYDHSH
jgi:hypothetical protein